MTNTTLSPRLSIKAVVALVLGLSSVVLSILTAIPALLLGLHTLREINRSGGRLRGKKLAGVGMVLGALSTVASLIVGGAAMIVIQLRETAGQAECQHHLMHVGHALNLYHDQEQAFPAGTIPNATLPPAERLSWYVSILPFLGAELPPPETGPQPERRERGSKQEEEMLKALFRSIDLDKGWQAAANAEAVAKPVRRLRCPSDPHQAPPGQPALTDYVGIAGMGADAALLPADSPDAGVFGYNRRVSREQVTRGADYTMMVTETAWQNGPWAAGGTATVRGLDPAQQPYIGRGRPFGGNHPDGLNVLYVGGSVKFVRQTIEPQLFERMATIKP